MPEQRLMIYELLVNDAMLVDGKWTALSQKVLVPMVRCLRKGAPQQIEECLNCNKCSDVRSRYVVCAWVGPEKKEEPAPVTAMPA